MNTSRSYYDTEARTVALAGVFQAGALVADVAHGRPLDEAAMRATLNSLFVTDPASVEDVFGGISGVRLGLLLVRDGLTPERKHARSEVLGYVLRIAQAERRFARRQDLQEILHTRLDRVATQREHFDLLHDTVISALANTYESTISTLRQRIQVVGNAAELQKKRNADRIRSALLGGVRAALLWNQTGGRLWRLLFDQNAVRCAADRLVRSIADTNPPTGNPP